MSHTLRVVLCLILAAAVLTGCQTKDPEKSKEAAFEVVEPSESVPKDTEAPKEPKATKAKVEEIKSETWVRTYGGKDADTVEDVLQAKDGGFYILGATNIDWESGSGNLLLIRTDKYGEVLWEKTYPGEPHKTGSSLIYTKDGNILIAGQTAVDYETRMDIFLMKVDPKGNELESKVFGGPMDEWVNSVQQTKDGGYILFGNIVDPDDFVTDPGVAGYGGFENRSSILVIKLDEDFEEEWVSNLDNGKNTYSIGGMPAFDGGYLIVSSILAFPELNDTLYLVKLDSDGNQLWSRTWDEPRTNARSYSLSSTGNLLIGAVYSASGDPRDGDADFFLLEVDQEGNEVWRSIFGVPDEVDMICGFLETKDGGYVLIGDRSQDLRRSDSQMVLIKLDKDREILWEKILDEKPHFMISSLLEIDEGYVIASSFFTRYTDQPDIILVKTDPEGAISE